MSSIGNISNLPGNRNSTPEGSNTLRPPQARSLIGAGHALRASADMGAYANAPLSSRLRPSSEVYFNQTNSGQGHSTGEDIDKATQQWLADIDQYEATLEEMATATLDQEFKDELSAIEQWFRVLSEAERTSALYALIQQTTQVQQRFFIQVLTEMAKNHPMSNILSPATFGPKDPMSQKLSDAMSKLTVEGSRNSVGLGRPPPTPGNKRNSGLDPSVISSMFPDAANAIAKQKEQFTQQTGLAPASARNSIIMAGDRGSLIAPSISAISPPEDGRVDSNMPPPASPWTSSRAPDVQPPIARPRSSAGQQPMGQFTQSLASAGLRSSRPAVGLSANDNVQNTTLAAPNDPLSSINHLLSPYAPGASWASMVNTPMVPNFNVQQQAAQNADLIANATAMKLAALSTVNNRINFDDARNFRRDTRGQVPGRLGNGMTSPGLPPANFVMTNEHGQVLTPQQAAALQAQQLASISGSRSRPSSPGLMVTGASGNISAVNFPMQQNGFLSAYDNTTAAALAGLNLNQFGINNMSTSQSTHQGLSNMGMGMNMGMGLGPHDGYISDHSEINRGRSPRGRRGSSKPPEDPTSIELLQDIPNWLRSLRLHKYTDQLKDMRWQDLVELDDKGLEDKGVNALGARRKMLKVFEQVHEQRAAGTA